MLRRTDEDGNWYPVSVARLEELLAFAIMPHPKYPHAKALRKNIAYNLQYIEYLDQTLQDLKLSGILTVHTQKSAIVAGCAVLEALLHYLLLVKERHATTPWALVYVAPGNPKSIDSKTVKIDSHVYEKAEPPMPIQMTFDSMLKRSEKSGLLGDDHSIYAKLNRLRPLRNRIHLQEIAHSSDTDWFAFNSHDYKSMIQVVHATLMGKLFSPSAEQHDFFKYMERHIEP